MYCMANGIRAMMAAALAAVLLAACAPPQPPDAPLELVYAKAYRQPGPATISLITMVSNRTGSGGHSALLINASQRVIFDPAGSFENARVPERDDVLYGVTPAVLQGYRSAHARSTYHVVTQTIKVTPEQAETALSLAQKAGPVPRSYCTSATTQLLQQVPGFDFVERTMFPTRLMEQFAARSDVVTERYYEDDEGTILDGVAKVQIE